MWKQLIVEVTSASLKGLKNLSTVHSHLVHIFADLIDIKKMRWQFKGSSYLPFLSSIWKKKKKKVSRNFRLYMGSQRIQHWNWTKQWQSVQSPYAPQDSELLNGWKHTTRNCFQMHIGNWRVCWTPDSSIRRIISWKSLVSWW